MKLRYIVILWMSLSTISAWSQTHMYVQMTSGDIFYYKLAELPAITYTNTELSIKTTLNSSHRWLITDIQHIGYTKHNPIRKTQKKKVATEPIAVYSINGNHITTIQEPEDINSMHIPMGVYILKNTESTKKIIIR